MSFKSSISRDIQPEPVPVYCTCVWAHGLFQPSAKKHGPNNNKDIKPQMSSLLVFNIVYRLGIQLVMLGFSNLGGEGGLRQINTCRQAPFQVNF
jgi:hypothetical protein